MKRRDLLKGLGLGVAGTAAGLSVIPNPNPNSNSNSNSHPNSIAQEDTIEFIFKAGDELDDLLRIPEGWSEYPPDFGDHTEIWVSRRNLPNTDWSVPRLWALKGKITGDKPSLVI